MTTVEEDLLLNDPVASDYDNLAVIDEDLLLDASDISRRPTSTDDAAAALLLDSVEHASEQDPEEVPDLLNKTENDDEIESEKEELDYDEEEDDDEGRRERTSRYTSERKGGASRQDSEDGENMKKENGDGKTKRPGIPSLFDKTITNPMKNSDQPIGVILRIEGEADRIFYPPPAFMMHLHQQHQPIVPRLPNGIPLIGTPSNHGRAGFGVGYQQQQQPHQGRLAGGGGTVMIGQWDNEVEKFLSSTKSRGGTKKRRSASYSSVSSYSSGSRSRSRSSSRDERRRRDEKRRRRDDRRYDRRDDRDSSRRDDRRGGDSRRGEVRRRHDDRRSRERDSYSDRRRKEQSKISTMESAKALGLPQDYIELVNKQKRLREEQLKKKEERRNGQSVTSTSESNERKEASFPSTSSSSINKDSSSSSKEKSIKAYLAVNVCGVQQLTTAVKKIEALASELGPIKKCWRSADDVVSIIFNAHDKAKDFMIKYNGKVLSGLRIAVSLEKKFLNLAEIN